MPNVHGRGADLSFFGVRPRSNIGTDKSAVHIVRRNPTAFALTLFTNSNLFICRISHRFSNIWYDSASGGLVP